MCVYCLERLRCFAGRGIHHNCIKLLIKRKLLAMCMNHIVTSYISKDNAAFAVVPLTRDSKRILHGFKLWSRHLPAHLIDAKCKPQVRAADDVHYLHAAVMDCGNFPFNKSLSPAEMMRLKSISPIWISHSISSASSQFELSLIWIARLLTGHSNETHVHSTLSTAVSRHL